MNDKTVNKPLVIVLVVLLLVCMMMLYRSSTHNKALEGDIAELKEYSETLEKEIVVLKQAAINHGSGQSGVPKISTDPSIDELINDAGSVIKHSLESVIDSLEAEFGKAKEQLYQELDKLKSEQQLPGTGESDRYNDGGSIKEKHET